MTSQVFYVLTTTGDDVYAAMTRVSIASIRISNPSLRVNVATDPWSARALEVSNHRLLSEIDELRMIDTDEGEAEMRNRFIKTRLRNLVDGPFLFLDSDTFVRESLVPIFEYETDIAAAPNHSADKISAQIWKNDRAMSRKMGWPVGRRPYVNGGVLFYNDTAGAFALANQWHENWKLSQNHCRSFRDQPALNAAIESSQVEVGLLPHRFNAQFRCNSKVAKDSAVWHYYSSDSGPGDTQFEVVVDALSASESVSNDTLQQMVSCSHPWRWESSVDSESKAGGEYAVDAVCDSRFAIRRRLWGLLCTVSRKAGSILRNLIVSK